MKRTLTTLLSCLLLLTTAWADGPFRNHRYDAFKALKVNSDNIVFVGNSITNMHEWCEAFGNSKVLNRGNSGGLSGEIFDNVESYIAGKPAKMFLMIGTNDIGTSGFSNSAYIAGKIRSIVKRVKAESPNTELYIQSILPSRLRNLALQKETNDSIKKICQENNLTYIDLWDDLMGITSGEALSLDGLHLKATGYKIWCDKIAQYVGSDCVYLDDAATNSQTGGLSGSYGMRVSYFGGLPVNDGDVLMIGDEMIHGGEWHELLHCDNVKSRGNGWGYPGVNIANISSSMNAILKGRSTNGEPGKIFLYAGVADVNGDVSLAGIKTNYEALVNQTRTLAPNAKIYLLSLLPKNDAASNTGRVAPFNELIKEVAASKDNVEFVDIYTPLLGSNNVANTDYITQNYVYAKGYAKISEIIAPLLAEEGATATTVEEVEANIELLAARTRLGNILTTIQDIKVGNHVGQYPESAFADLNNKKDEIIAVLSKDNPTVEEITALEATCGPVLESLLTHINMPKPSVDGDEHWYTFCTSLRGNKYMTGAKGSDQLKGGDKTNFATTWWKLVERTDGSFDIINKETGKYISPDAAYNTQIKLVSAQPAAGWTLSYSSTLSMFIVSSGKVQLNQTNKDNAIYNWSAGESGQDRSDTGCQFTITEVTGEPAINNELLTGWYRIKVATGSDATMQGYIANDLNQILNADYEYRQVQNGNIYYYPLSIGAVDEAKPAKAFIHLTKDNNVYYVKGLNGHFVQENCTALRLQPTNNAVIQTSAADPANFTIGKWSWYTPSGVETVYLGKSSSSNNTFSIQPVDAEELATYRQYTVSISGAESAAEIGNDPSVVCTSSANAGLNKVFNNGVFFFPSSYRPVASDFMPTGIDGLVSTVEVGENTITVEYFPAEMDDYIEAAEATLDLKGVGYPVEGSAGRSTLSQAIETARSVEVNAANIAALLDAVAAYKSQSTDIQMPEDGKAYAFLNVQYSSPNRYITYAGEATGLGTSVAGESVPANAIFVCHKLESGKYILVNPEGKFMLFRGSNDGPEGNKGYADRYLEATADFTFIRPTLANKQDITAGVTDADFFGCVSFSASRANGAQSNMIIDKSGAFSQAGTTIFFNANFSNVFKVVEVPYYNAPEFVSVQGEGWETLCLPFATIIPEGVTASTGRIEDGKLKLTAIEDGVLPANTAVLLQGTEGKHVFAPSTTAGTPVEDNAFWGTMDASAEAPANLYAFGEKNGWAAFKPIGTETVQPAKAYLAGASDEVEAYFISLPTSIEGAAVISGEAAPTYDLSGRRVNKPSRGIYLQNGKKVILR